MVIGIIFLLICIAASIICNMKDKDMAAVFFWILSVIIGLILFINLINSEILQKEKDNDNVVSAVVYDVSGYQVDTNIIITDTDTTKTYSITYWREQN